MSVTALVAALWAAPLASQQAALTVGQFQQLAVAALEAGNTNVAIQAADVLLNRDPKDPGVLILRTEAAILANDFAGAVSFGRRAYWNANSSLQRFSAARLVALAHSRQNQDTRAQGWLRLARQDAPNEQQRVAVANDFRFLRDRNPLAVNLRFGISPTTNLNGGSVDDELILGDFVFTLSTDTIPLSGWEISAGADISYLVHTNETSATFLTYGFSGNTYLLTERSLDILEDDDERSNGSDFANASLSFGVTHRFALSPTSQATSTSLSFNTRWNGGELTSQNITASASHSWKLSDHDRLSLSAIAQDRTRYGDSDPAPIQNYTVRTGWTRDLQDLGRIGLSIAVGESESADINEDYSFTRYGLDYSFPEPLYGVQMSAGIQFEDRDYPVLVFSEDRRRDTITSVNLRGVFTEIEYFGFRPVLTASKTVRESDFVRFDTDTFNFGFDLSSSF